MTTPPAEHLALTLVGRWHRFESSDTVALRRQVHAYVRATVGVRDDQATARAELRTRLTEVVGEAARHRASAVFVCEEVSPGVALPAMVTVFHPMPVPPAGPATASAAREGVLEAMRRDLVATAAGGKESACVRVAAGDGEALRVVTIDEAEAVEGAPTSRVRSVRADYWVLWPDGDRVSLVSCFTPLGDIPHAMVRLFDAIVARARIVAETRVA
ncbi:hypothetical protein [Demequina sp. NBRC 110057]|uniref:hypothetical protein n=1 Tax=Demequina sp. NBRC 110057 TaxID=1570346 RepID=UPI0009FFB85D|nr:hypothetical protein [Demequina sp. NBRC 110057]